MELLYHLVLYFASFLLIWLAAGLIVSSVDRFSHRLRLSSFAVSFVILGLLTSTPEFAVGLTAVAQNDAEIFIGNLLGGIPVIFLLVIPLLAIFGNGINLRHELSHRNTIATLLVILLPSVMILDHKIGLVDGLIAIITYIFLVILVQKNNGLFDHENTEVMNLKAYSYKDMIKILIGLGLMFITSSVIVDETIYLSNTFNISQFFISLLVLSLGTNLPELSLAIRSVVSKKKDIAFGDYLGSAAANTLIFGVMTILIGGGTITQNGFLITFFFIALGLLLFYVFSRTKSNISRREGLILLGIYALFVLSEIFF